MHKGMSGVHAWVRANETLGYGQAKVTGGSNGADVRCHLIPFPAALTGLFQELPGQDQRQKV